MDYETKKQYWVDALEDTIESVSINGEDRRVVSSENVSSYVSLILEYFLIFNRFTSLSNSCQLFCEFSYFKSIDMYINAFKVWKFKMKL